MAFSYEIQKVIEKAQNLRFSEDFVLLMAPAGGLEPLAYCLGGSRSIQLSYAGEWNWRIGIELETVRLCLRSGALYSLLRSMAYHVIHGSDVTSNIIPYAEWLVVNELYGAKHLFWRSFMCPLGGPISKFLARGHPAKVDCYCHSSFP